MMLLDGLLSIWIGILWRSIKPWVDWVFGVWVAITEYSPFIRTYDSFIEIEFFR